MAEQVLDLWPQIDVAGTETPLMILKQQAALLGKHTRNLLEARVKTVVGANGFAHRLVIEAPTLGGYSFELFQVSHDLKLFPVQVDWLHASDGTQALPSLTSKEALLNWLGVVLKSEATKRLLSSLLAQAES